MTHTAPLILAQLCISIEPSKERRELFAHDVQIIVDYRHVQANGASTFVAQAARLANHIHLFDLATTMKLELLRGYDILEHLTARQLDWIEEHLPVPA
jgi:hypothetical protein